MRCGKMWLMNDEIQFRTLRSAIRAGAASLVVLTFPALADEVVRYEAPPAWAEQTKLDPALIRDPVQQVLFDSQYRLEGGVVGSYFDSAVHIATPDTLTEEGTVTLTWSPDKGDLLVHRVEILRDGKIIDVLAGGARFDVLRREQGLEQRLLDGQLTATLAVPGLKIDDILRVVHTTTLSDQALGEEMQVTQYLPSEPWQVGKARTIVSWPAGEAIQWRAEGVAGQSEPKTVDGYRRLEVALPLAKPPEMPVDAPSRFTRGAVLRVGTFADWQELSRVLYPHYDSAARIAEDGAVAEEAAGILRIGKDPLERAALALRLVQDDVSYLLNGMDGGNYLPQSAAETWEKRYGDCKAKSVLLLALLRQMGIEAQPVLVVSQGGDALPDLLPLPADFDHMIVRATIDGQDYWLDGTSTATRMTNIAEVPAFFHALPLTAEGSALVPVTQRPQPFPDMIVTIASDYSAGIDMPFLFTLDLAIYGPQGAGLRSVAERADPATLAQIARRFSSDEMNGSAISSIAVDYDADAGAGLVTIKGVSESDFEWTDGRFELGADVQMRDHDFNPDRARADWRAIPVFTSGPSLTKLILSAQLPEDGGDFALTGTPNLDAAYANTHLKRTAKLVGGEMNVVIEVAQALGEVAPADLPEAKRAARRLASYDAKLVASADARRKWEVSAAEMRKRAAPLVKAYDQAIAIAEENDWAPLSARARFYSEIYDYELALADYDRLIAEAPSSGTYLARALVYQALGRGAEAIADLRTAYDLEPENGTAYYLAEMLAYEGRGEEALALLEGLPVGEDERDGYADSLATVSGLHGDTASGLVTLERAVADKPQNASLLNSDCWFRGLFNVALDEALARCTRAVERAENAAPVLDSRAMVRYRLGQYDAALADLDAALALSPELAASRYLRGIVRLEKGEAGGREDIAMALRISPDLATRYARHGVRPKN